MEDETNVVELVHLLRGEPTCSGTLALAVSWLRATERFPRSTDAQLRWLLAFLMLFSCR